MKTTLRVDGLGILVMAGLLWGAAFQAKPVADAAMKGDVEAVRMLIEQGADVNEAHGDGMTALHWAANHADPELAEFLIGAGANLEAKTRIGDYTPLHVASRAGAGGVVEALLVAGADLNVRTTNTGVKSIHLAAEGGSSHAVRALLAHGADVDDRDDFWGQTPLMVAAAHGHLDVMDALVEGGADASLRAKVWNVPQRSRVDGEAARARSEVLRQFRDAEDGGGSPSLEVVRAAVLAAREVETDGPTFDYPDPKVIRAENEGYVPWSDGYAQLMEYEGGLTPLLMAVREGHMAAMDRLLETGADINQISAGDLSSPLLMAVVNGHFDIAYELLQRGADPNLMSNVGAAPLYVTLNRRWIPRTRHPQRPEFRQQQVDYLELMEALLEAGADPNAQLERELWYHMFGLDHRSMNFGEVGATSFLRAAYAQDVEAMKLLYRYGADPKTPSAAPQRRTSVGYGLVFPDEDMSGLPPIPVGGPGVYAIHAAAGVGFGQHYAAANGHEGVPDGWLSAVRYLVEEHGAEVNARDYAGYTALHHAASRGDNELILYLVEQGADPLAVARSGQTTLDMANGPFSRLTPHLGTIRLLEDMGAVNNHNCQSC